MVAARRRASDGSDEDREYEQTVELRNASSDDDGRPVRQIRLARKTVVSGQSSSQSSGRKSTRARRAPTPVARNRRGQRDQATNEGNQEQEEEQVIDSYSDDEETHDEQGNQAQRAHTKYSTSQRRNEDGTTTIRRSRHVSRRAVASNQDGNDRSSVGLTWYERLMPSFMLNMTAPLTGYENEVSHSDIEDDEEYAVLDRSRIKRNRRIRRRLVTIMFLAAAASLLIYTRGRVLKKVGVKAAVTSMKQRIEDGLAKTVQETMGK